MPVKTKSLAVDGVNGSPAPPVVSWIPNVKVTVERKPFLQPDDDQRLPHTGTARANIAATYEKPYGTTEGGWSRQHQDKTVLQQHCEFFDSVSSSPFFLSTRSSSNASPDEKDRDGVIWPQDTFEGFRRLGFGMMMSLLSVLIIHANFSYPTVSGWLPDPFFRVHLANVHKDKHGSDTGTYDSEGRFVPQRFEDVLAKYAAGRDYLTVWDVLDLLKGQRCILDPIGWFGAFFEWLATYLLLWPADGRMMKEDIRGIYDGSIFYTIANRRAPKKHK
ncbi:Caleosin-domain-containing protein [Hypoxylon sp. FL1284]|nr:Caleosin-domain-containing protein [Hypoxylon sp. FL1284]